MNEIRLPDLDFIQKMAIQYGATLLDCRDFSGNGDGSAWEEEAMYHKAVERLVAACRLVVASGAAREARLREALPAFDTLIAAGRGILVALGDLGDQAPEFRALDDALIVAEEARAALTGERDRLRAALDTLKEADNG